MACLDLRIKLNFLIFGKSWQSEKEHHCRKAVNQTVKTLNQKDEKTFEADKVNKANNNRSIEKEEVSYNRQYAIKMPKMTLYYMRKCYMEYQKKGKIKQLQTEKRKTAKFLKQVNIKAENS